MPRLLGAEPRRPAGDVTDGSTEKDVPVRVGRPAVGGNRRTLAPRAFPSRDESKPWSSVELGLSSDGPEDQQPSASSSCRRLWQRTRRTRQRWAPRAMRHRWRG